MKHEYTADRLRAEIRRLRAELEQRDIEDARRQAQRIVFEVWLVCGGVLLGAVVSAGIRLV